MYSTKLFTNFVECCAGAVQAAALASSQAKFCPIRQAVLFSLEDVKTVETRMVLDGGAPVQVSVHKVIHRGMDLGGALSSVA